MWMSSIAGVLDQVRAHVGAAVARPRRKPRSISGANARSMNGPDVLVDRVHLEHAHLALDEHLVEHVGGRDARHVAGAQHQRHAALAVALACRSAPGARGRLGRVDARLHAARRRVKPANSTLSMPLVGNDVDHDAPVGRVLDARGLERRLPVRAISSSALDEQAQVADATVGPASHSSAAAGDGGSMPLALQAGHHALFGHLDVTVEELAGQRDALGRPASARTRARPARSRASAPCRAPGAQSAGRLPSELLVSSHPHGACESSAGQVCRVQGPDFPPDLASSRTSVRRMPRSIALHMS